jgi:hypothetical protein
MSVGKIRMLDGLVSTHWHRVPCVVRQEGADGDEHTSLLPHGVDAAVKRFIENAQKLHKIT